PAGPRPRRPRERDPALPGTARERLRQPCAAGARACRPRARHPVRRCRRGRGVRAGAPGAGGRLAHPVRYDLTAEAGVRHDTAMLFADLAQASEDVRATPARSAKVARLAALIAALAPDEVP